MQISFLKMANSWIWRRQEINFFFTYFNSELGGDRETIMELEEVREDVSGATRQVENIIDATIPIDNVS